VLHTYLKTLYFQTALLVSVSSSSMSATFLVDRRSTRGTISSVVLRNLPLVSTLGAVHAGVASRASCAAA